MTPPSIRGSISKRLAGGDLHRVVTSAVLGLDILLPGKRAKVKHIEHRPTSLLELNTWKYNNQEKLSPHGL